jgi:aerobic carbon-monoxide dehydrogenase medium subunit
MKPARFAYFRPRNATEAVIMMRSAGDGARFLAGGQSLVPMMNFRIAQPVGLVDLSACSDLAFVRHEGGRLRIGAMTRQRDVELDALVRQHCPLVAVALSKAGPVTIRNRATAGGSIANGYPIAELPVVAVCLEAEMVLVNDMGARTVAAADFFLSGMVTAIEPSELLREIVVPARGPSTRYGFAERGNHAGGAALAIVAGCAEVAGGDRVTHVSIAAAGLETIPVRLKTVEATLVAKGLGVAVDEAYRADLAKLEALESGQDQLVKALVADVIAAMSTP